ncbi:DUF3024 domain-containing protein [Polaromonas sp.]|uniref:DUF3024 domain-containing protein n=1 Tax=Polaromonas sp. TaxID=1869339 RepID=UPI0017FF23CE|nr:DUF3024 domain-containing protein [Polaromonas sp.]NMM08151.1 DUF3024 domain-containing protein [Polaromonas sp.]
MDLREFEKKAQKALDVFLRNHRPPPHIRPQLHLGGRMNGQSKELFGIRPRLGKPENKLELPVAKATYVKTRVLWNVYRQRAELKWHRYDPAPQVASLEKLLSLMGEDEGGCFFGWAKTNLTRPASADYAEVIHSRAAITFSLLLLL